MDGIYKICHLDTFLSLPHWPITSAVHDEVRREAISQACRFSLLHFVFEELEGPLVDLLFGFRFRHAIAFLDLASQYLDIAFDLLYVVVCEFAPLVAHTSMQP